MNHLSDSEKRIETFGFFRVLLSSNIQVKKSWRFFFWPDKRAEVQDSLKMNSTDTVTLGRFNDCMSIYNYLIGGEYPTNKV